MTNRRQQHLAHYHLKHCARRHMKILKDSHDATHEANHDNGKALPPQKNLKARKA